MSRVLKPTFERNDARGLFQEWVNSGEWKELNYGSMKEGGLMGNHYHKVTEMMFFLISGSADVVIENIKTRKKENLKLGPREGVAFHPFESHALKFTADTEFVMLKSGYDPKNPDIFEPPVM